MKKRPAGVTLIVILFFILGGLSLLWSGLVFGVGGLSALVGGVFGADQITGFGESAGWSGFVGIFAAALQIIVAFGLLGIKKWAWALALISVGVTVVQGLIGMFTGGLFGFMCGGIGLIVPVIILVYLLTPKVRKAFGQ
jgi:hypothetical protein